MKKVTSLLIFMFVITLGIMAKGTKMPQYEIVGAGSGNEGMVLVKVSVYAKKNVADSELKRAATHGVVFRGFTGNNSGAHQPAMASPIVENDNSEFCEVFFASDGQCQSYATILSGSYERVKVKKGYKYSALVRVNKTALRKELEKAGIVRSLSSGF